MPKRISRKSIYISIRNTSYNTTIGKLSGIYKFHSAGYSAATFINGEKKTQNNDLQQEGEAPYYLIYLKTKPAEFSGWYIQDSKSFDGNKVEGYLRILTKGKFSFLYITDV